MGLDIYHDQLINNRPPNIGYKNDGIYLENEFVKFNERDWEIIKPYVKKIEYYNCVKSIFFSTVPSEIDFLTRELKEVEFLTGDTLLDLEKNIKAFEKKHNLSKCYKEVNDSIPPWNKIKYFEKEIKLGFYTKNIGYQRKGMSNKFWEHFDYENTYHYYFKEEDFLKAYSCVDHYWDSDSQEEVRLRKIKFKADFIDQYENGKSFMLFSF